MLSKKTELQLNLIKKQILERIGWKFVWIDYLDWGNITDEEDFLISLVIVLFWIISISIVQGSNRPLAPSGVMVISTNLKEINLIMITNKSVLHSDNFVQIAKT